MTEASGTTHKLTRLSAHEGRAFERHPVSLPCRVSFTTQHLRGVRTLFALTRNVSRSGVLLVLQRPVEDVRFLVVELSPEASPHPAVVRRDMGNELACEFLTPLTAQYMAELLETSLARERSDQSP